MAVQSPHVLQGLESTDPPSSKPRVYNQGLFDIRPFSSVGILDPLTCAPKIWPRILRVLTNIGARGKLHA